MLGALLLAASSAAAFSWRTPARPDWDKAVAAARAASSCERELRKPAPPGWPPYETDLLGQATYRGDARDPGARPYRRCWRIRTLQGPPLIQHKVELSGPLARQGRWRPEQVLFVYVEKRPAEITFWFLDYDLDGGLGRKRKARVRYAADGSETQDNDLPFPDDEADRLAARELRWWAARAAPAPSKS